MILNGRQIKIEKEIIFGKPVLHRLEVRGNTVDFGNKSSENPSTMLGTTEIAVSNNAGVQQVISIDPPAYGIDDDTHDTIDLVSGDRTTATEIKQLTGAEPWEYDSTSLTSAGGDILNLTDSQDGGEFTKLETEGKSNQLVTVQGKNLFDAKQATSDSHNIVESNIITGGFTVTSAVSGTYQYIQFNLALTPHILHYFSYLSNGTSPDGAGVFVFDSTISTVLAAGGTNGNISFTVPSNGIACILFYVTKATSGSYTATFSNIMLSTDNSAYEPFVPDSPSFNYKADVTGTTKLTVSDGTTPHDYLLPQTLYSLPDGTADEYDIVTGVGTQKIKKVTWNGSENWVIYVGSENSNTVCFAVAIPSMSDRLAGDGTTYLSDKFQYINQVFNSAIISEGYWLHTNQVYAANCYVRVNKSRLTGWSDGSKNLFDKTKVEQGTIGNYPVGASFSTLISDSVNRCRTSQLISAKSLTTYTVSNLGNTQWLVKEFDNSQNFVIPNVMWNTSGISFTTQSATAYIALMFRKSDDSVIIPLDVQNDDYQLELGSTATSYVDYVAPWTSAQKNTAFKSWLAANPVTVLYELATPIAIAGTAQMIPTYTNTNVSTDGGGDISATYVNNSPVLYAQCAAALEKIGLCTHFANQVVDSKWHDGNEAIGLINDILYLKISKNVAKTMTTLESWLLGQTVKFVSKLAEAATLKNDANTVRVYYPTTLITNNTESEMTVDFLTFQEKNPDIIKIAPKAFKNSNEMIDIQNAFNIQLEKIQDTKDDLLLQLNVETATWGLRLWEKALALNTDESKPYEFRRSRIESKLRSQGVTTKAMIKNLAKSFSNGDVDIIEHPAEYRFDVKFVGTLGVPPNMDDLAAAIEEIKPAHLAYAFVYIFVTHKQLKRFTYAQLAQFTHKQIRNGEVLNLGN